MINAQKNLQIDQKNPSQNKTNKKNHISIILYFFILYLINLNQKI